MCPGTAVQADAFDVNVAITAFMADSEATTLELPPMSPGERKAAKKAAEAHPGIACESFGFGADRKLLLLKRKPAAPTSGSRESTSADATSADQSPEKDSRPAQKLPLSLVKIKNTFIDDWDAEARGAAGQALYNSMPAQLLPSQDPSHVLMRPSSSDDGDEAGAIEGTDRGLYSATPAQLLPSRNPANVLLLPPAVDDDADAQPSANEGPAMSSSTPAQLRPSCNTSHVLPLPPAYDDDCDAGTNDASADKGLHSSTPALLLPSRSPSHVLPLPPAFDDEEDEGTVEVRNTFIHIQASADERIIQSMPHGMFGKLLQSMAEEAEAEESSEKNTQEEATSKATEEAPPTVTEQVPRSPARVVQPVKVELEPAVAGASIAPQQHNFPMGSVVIIEGLSKCPAFNGCCGVVQYFDADLARYSVVIVGADGRQQFAKVRAENMLPLQSPYEYLPGCVDYQAHQYRGESRESCHRSAPILHLSAVV